MLVFLDRLCFSSQSMYGVSNTELELDEDNSEKGPVTACAKAKWKAEQELHKMSTEKFVVTSMRPQLFLVQAQSFE